MGMFWYFQKGITLAALVYLCATLGSFAVKNHTNTLSPLVRLYQLSTHIYWISGNIRPHWEMVSHFLGFSYCDSRMCVKYYANLDQGLVADGIAETRLIDRLPATIDALLYDFGQEMLLSRDRARESRQMHHRSPRIQLHQPKTRFEYVRDDYMADFLCGLEELHHEKPCTWLKRRRSWHNNTKGNKIPNWWR